MLRRRKMLGLAVTSRSVTAVEVVAANGSGRARRAAELVFAEGAGLQEPAGLGKALRQFLRAHGFSASRCVVGMEAAWLTARAKTLPPGAGASVGEILSLMIEREFASDRKDLVFDYTLQADTAGKRSALVVAAPKNILGGLTLMAQAAGLTVAGITSTTMALAAATNGAATRDQLVLHLFGGGAELALHAEGELRMVRHLPVSVPFGRGTSTGQANGWLEDLAGQLRRIVSLLPGETGRPSRRELSIWNDAGLDEAACATLSDRLSLPVRLCEQPAGLDTATAGSPSPGAQFSAAAAMALGALAGRRPAVDLLHSRLAPRRRLAVGRKVAWAGAVIAALVVAGTVLALDWRNDSIEAAALAERLAVMKDDLDDARGTIAKVTFARPWYDQRPSYLACMRELTLAFPEEGLIWTTSLAVQEDMQVVFSGKAASESAVLDVLDRLKANSKLSDVKPLYLRKAGRDRREIAFAMSFTYTPLGRTWSSPSAKRSSSPRR